MKPPFFNAFAQFEGYERSFVQECHAIIDRYTNNGFDFIGFVYNGVVLPECRDQTIAISTRALKALSIEKKRARHFLQSLTRLYLNTYGVGTTINNLVLEADYYVSDGTEPRSVSLSISEEQSFIAKLNSSRQINISLKLARTLGLEHPVWEQIALELKTGQSIKPETKSVLEGLAEAITNGTRYIVSSEQRFLTDFELYLFQPNRTPCPSETLKLLPGWLRAIQGLFMFMHSFGRYWVTAPVKPSFMERFKEIGFRIPCCAITAISHEKQAPEGLFQAREEIEFNAARVQRRIERASKAFISYLQNEQRKLYTDLKNIWREWTPEVLGKRFLWTIDIERFLHLGINLVGKQHEQKSLSFILLCAPAGSLLRYHVRSAQKPWVLRSAMRLISEDFPSLDETIAERQLSALVFSIEANSFFLQEPGRALFFFPVSSQFAPRHVVEFEPFDPRDLETLLRDFTSAEETALAIHVTERDAKLFAGGTKVAIGHGKQWQKCDEGLDADHGHDLLTREINELPGWTLASEQRVRLDKICRAVIHVSKRGYGALFFLTRGKRRLKSTNLAPVWSSSSMSQVDAVADTSLAAYAGLDGEMCLDLDSGKCQARQFCHVPPDDFLDILERKRGRLGLNAEYAQEYHTMQATFEGMEDREELYKMGTRHQKALRITWAKTYRETTIAITVSSDGPIRLWYHGFPIRKWPSVS